MPDDPTPPPEDAEKSFWEKMTQTLDARIGEALDKRLKPAATEPPKTDPPKTDPPKTEPEPPGSSRMANKRVTLPGLIADVVFGPSKD